MPKPQSLQFPEQKELLAIARKYELSGAGIVNVVQYCCIDTLTGQAQVIPADQIRIKREFQKEGKVF